MSEAGGLIFLSKVQERDIVGNAVLPNMVAAEKRLEELEVTIRENHGLVFTKLAI